MGKMNQKKGNKREPLKVVYISNPIKFKATASEFMALVQELTGQYADTPESPTFTVDEDAGEAAADEDNVHERQVGQIGHPAISYGEVLDQHDFGSYDDLFLCPENLQLQGGLVGSNLVDLLKNLDAM